MNGKGAGLAVCSYHTFRRAPLSLGGGGGVGTKCFSLIPRMAPSVRSFPASWVLLGVWGSCSLMQEMLMEQEKGTEVLEGDLWLQRDG